MRTRDIERRRPRRALARRSESGQALVEYLVATAIVVMAISAFGNTSLFSTTADILAAVKDYFKAFAYAISVAAT